MKLFVHERLVGTLQPYDLHEVMEEISENWIVTC